MMSMSEIKILILEALDKNERLPKIDGFGDASYKILLKEMEDEGLIDITKPNWEISKCDVRITSKGITYLETFRLNHK